MLRLATVLLACSAAAGAVPDHDAATRLVAALPEAVALGRLVAERSNGRVRAVVMPDGDGPEGWYVAVLEKHSRRTVRLLTVRVGRDGALAVWDEDVSAYVALEQWRLRQPR